MLHHARVGLGTPTDALATYGQSAATKVIDAVSAFPPAQRAVQIQKLLNGIDRTLWPAVNKLIKKGVPWQPALTSVFSSHVVSFFARVGTGQGLSGQLGAALNPRLLTTVAANAALAPTPTSYPAGTCTADGQYIWRADANGVPGHWERKGAGEQCAVISNVPTLTNTGPQGGTSVTFTDQMQVGPFVFGWNRNGSPVTWTYATPDQLTDDQAVLLHSALAKQPDDGAYWRPVPASPWMQRFGFKAGDSYNVRMLSSGMPYSGLNSDAVIAFSYPDMSSALAHAFGTNSSVDLVNATAAYQKKWGLYAWIDGSGQLNITVMPLIPGEQWYEELVGGFYSGTVAVAGALSTVVCGLASNPAAAAAAATAAGGPAAGGAAAAGAAVVKGQCNQGQQPVPQIAPPAPPPAKTPWGYIIAGALALVGVGAYVLTAPPPRRAA